MRKLNIHEDAKLYLFGKEYNLLTYDNDSEARGNVLFNYTVEANKTYVLRVVLHYAPSTTQPKSVKIGIIPASTSNPVYEAIPEVESIGFTYQLSASLDTIRIMTFTPQRKTALIHL